MAFVISKGGFLFRILTPHKRYFYSIISNIAHFINHYWQKIDLLFGFVGSVAQLIQKVLDAIRDLIRKLKGGENQKLYEMEKLWASALKEGNKNTANEGGVRYRIGRTTENRPFVEVEQDILAGVPEEDWVTTVKENLAEKFPNGVTVGNNEIRIDGQSRREMTFSKYIKWLYNVDPQLRKDKLRATDNADEILRATTGWVNEGQNHARKDKIVDFARGNVLLRIGKNDYVADVLVGTRKNGDMLLYDVLNLKKARFTEKETDTAITANPSPGADRSTVSISDNSIRSSTTKSNPQNAEKTKKSLKSDSRGRALTAAQQEYFADSQVLSRRLKGGENQKLYEMEKLWAGALKEGNKNAANEGGVRNSIKTLEDGKQYVKADRQVIFGNDPQSWSEQLEDYINGKIRRGQDVTLIGADGDELLLTATTAGKLSDNHTGDGRTMSDEAFERKMNAATHIDELAESSRAEKGTKKDRDERHGEMASGGWKYRTAYFEDFDGKYYEVTISTAKNENGTMLYNVGQMQERSSPKIDGSSAADSGALRGEASSTVSIRSSTTKSNPQNAEKAKKSLKSDSRGRALTAAQREYFADSQVLSRRLKGGERHSKPPEADRRGTQSQSTGYRK